MAPDLRDTIPAFILLRSQPAEDAYPNQTAHLAHLSAFWARILARLYRPS